MDTFKRFDSLKVNDCFIYILCGTEYWLKKISLTKAQNPTGLGMIFTIAAGVMVKPELPAHATAK